MANPAAHMESPAFGTALIVDDHPLFCDALSMTLRLSAGISEIRSAETLTQALGQIEEGWKPDVIMLDLNLPDVEGLDGLVRLKAAAGAVPIVVVSSMDDNRMVGSALRAGAAGFVPKHSQREVFQEAFATIAGGESFAPQGFVPTANGEGERSEAETALDRLSSLTRQQARILDLICEGKLNKQIAYDLSIAETTVKAHVTAIMRKLSVQSRTQAVLLAQQAKFAHVMHSENGTG